MLKLQQEITAVRVVISMERKSNYEGAAKVHTIKRYLTEIKDEETVSCGGLRCRELDCLRAYYYLAILNSLNHQQSICGDEESGNAKQNLAEQEGSPVDPKGTTKLTEVGEKSESESTLSDNAEKMAPEPVCENKTEVSALIVSEQKMSSSSENGKSSKDNSESSIDVENSVKVSTLTDSASSDQIATGEISTNEASGVNKADPSARGEVGVTSHGMTASDYQRQCSDSERTDLSQLTLSQLCHLSRGLLWDIQGKRYALMETLGYIHKAISQLLLAQKPNSLSSSQTDIHNETKAERDFGHSHGALLDEERDGLPGIFPRQPFFGSAVMKKRHNSEPLHQLPGVSEDILSHFHQHNHHQPHFSRSYSSEPKAMDASAHREHLCPSHSNQDLKSENSFDICVSCEMLNKSRKVLWEDEPHLGVEHSGKANLTNLINPAKYINVPDEWYNMSADQKYSMPYVTMAILKDEQEYMMHELKRGPDNLQVRCYMCCHVGFHFNGF